MMCPNEGDEEMADVQELDVRAWREAVRGAAAGAIAALARAASPNGAAPGLREQLAAPLASVRRCLGALLSAGQVAPPGEMRLMRQAVVSLEEMIVLAIAGAADADFGPAAAREELSDFLGGLGWA